MCSHMRVPLPISCPFPLPKHKRVPTHSYSHVRSQTHALHRYATDEQRSVVRISGGGARLCAGDVGHTVRVRQVPLRHWQLSGRRGVPHQLPCAGVSSPSSALSQAVPSARQPSPTPSLTISLQWRTHCCLRHTISCRCPSPTISFVATFSQSFVCSDIFLHFGHMRLFCPPHS